MSNHLEQLVSEWLQYRGYFVRTSVQVGPRQSGGFEGELDVVAVHPGKQHFLHIECSLDALSWGEREARYAKKFDCGRRHFRKVLSGFEVPETYEEIVVLQFGGGDRTHLGGARIVWTHALLAEIEAGLAGTSPSSKAIPSQLPLLRTVQLAAWARKKGGSAPGLLAGIVKP